ncbi:ubiquinol oxidase subunit II [Sphingomonas morindae]|uniref:Ubiquinol oxidase subunit 2 n=1 Tax=Sphingomonas morindae TaxID=1541170 RepID=A0ABY4X8R8_9SPHN|nr:ubiquinol oxidase subunit II [Sphingomonas morindae]USI73055.1 ubiquinol oxidase subunit II [Sphingomonas morindae]
MAAKIHPRRALRLAALAPLTLLAGCDWALVAPQGMIGMENRSTILWATLLMLIVVVPVIGMTLGFAWRYRANNLAADYAPEWSHSNAIEVVIWTIPALIVAALAWIAYDTTHRLDPFRPIASAAKPVEVQVVSLDWKWLFIYPEYGVASVNELAMPVGRPVNFSITSASVMNSFFIPRLGSQIYSMAGMQTKLHLLADKPGTYEGISANFSGDGFADMRFAAKAMDQKGFDAWIAAARKAPGALDLASYHALEKPSENLPVRQYGSVSPNLFNGILMAGMNPVREQRTVVPNDAAHTPGHAHQD